MRERRKRTCRRGRTARALGVPVLFLSGNEDGADPPANIAHAQRELPNSRTVVFPAAGHGQLGLPCAQALIAEFVARGTATGLDSLLRRHRSGAAVRHGGLNVNTRPGGGLRW